MHGPVIFMRLSPLNSRAFTLLELIVVMALIALITSFAVPQIASFLYADQLKVTVRKLVGLIHQSSQLALRHQAPYLLRYQQKSGLLLWVRKKLRKRSRKKKRRRLKEKRTGCGFPIQ